MIEITETAANMIKQSLVEGKVIRMFLAAIDGSGASYGLALEEKYAPIFLGLGGGHYVARQTDLIFQSSVAFGHLFSNYQIEKLNLDILEEARLKSGATYAYLDRKSLRSKERKILEGLLAEMDLSVLRSKEIRDRFPLA